MQCLARAALRWQLLEGEVRLVTYERVCQLRLGTLYGSQLGGPRSMNVFCCFPPPIPLFMLLLFPGLYGSTFCCSY